MNKTARPSPPGSDATTPDTPPASRRRSPLRRLPWGAIGRHLSPLRRRRRSTPLVWIAVGIVGATAAVGLLDSLTDRARR